MKKLKLCYECGASPECDTLCQEAVDHEKQAPAEGDRIAYGECKPRGRGLSRHARPGNRVGIEKHLLTRR